MKLLEENILKTVLYFNLLNFPPTFDEIYQNLPPLEGEIDKENLKQIIFELKKEGILENKDEFWFLSKRENLTQIRKSREKVSLSLWKFLQRKIKILKFFPFIEAVFVTGSLAINNSSSLSDIDIWVITSKGRLFFARALFNFFLKISSLKVSDKNTKFKICPNLYFSSDKMSFPFHSFFSAFQFFHATPVIDFSSVSEEFKLQNSWVKNYFQFWEEKFNPPFEILRKKPKITYFFEKIFSGKIGDLLEKIFKKIQIKIYQKNYSKKEIPGRVILKDWMVEDHPFSKEKEILRIFQREFLSLQKCFKLKKIFP